VVVGLMLDVLRSLGSGIDNHASNDVNGDEEAEAVQPQEAGSE